MIRIRPTLVVMLSLCFFQVTAQNLDFSSDGLLLNAPPESIKRYQLLFLSLARDGRAEKEDSIVTNNILYLDTLLNGTTSDELLLHKELAAVYNFFKNNRFDHCDTAKDRKFNYKTDLKKVYGQCLSDNDFIFFDSLLKTYPQKQNNDACFDNACLCYEKTGKLIRWVQLQNRLEDFKEKRRLIRDLLCVLPQERINHFKLRKRSSFYEPSEFVDTSSLFHPSQVATGYTYLVNKDTMIYDAKINKFSYSYKTDKKATFELTRVKNSNKQLIEWHNQHISQLNRGYLNNIRNEVFKDTSKVNKFIKALKCSGDCSEDDKTGLDILKQTFAKYDSVWCQTSPIAIWLKKWLWISKGEFNLNPFSFTTTNQQNIKAYEQAKRQDEKLAELNKRIDELKKCLTCNVKSLDTLKLLQDSADVIKEKRNALASIIKVIDANASQLEQFTSTSAKLHSLLLPTGQEHMLHHDASNNFEPANEEKVVLPESYAVYFGIYNSKNKEDESLKFDQTKLEFNDQSKFVQEMTEGLTALSTASTLLAPNYLSITSFLSKAFGSPTTNVLQDVSFFPDASPCEANRREIFGKLWRWQLLVHLLTEYTSNPTPGELTEKTTEQATYFTYVKKANEWAAPYTNKYVVKNKDKEILTNQYSIGREKTITIGAGVFFNQNPARIISTDVQGNTLTIKNVDNRAKYVIGLKIFPFKAFEADDNLKPKFFAKRWSVFAGFEITKPLNNLYLGIGYDVVPGLQFSAGAHVYRTDVYTIQNNQVTDQTTTYKTSGPYYGITLNPEVLAGIVKNFFK